MKNRDVYALALALLAENGSRTENGDYEERAGYLLAAFSSEAAEINRRYCEANGEASEVLDVPIYLSLDEDFPVKPRFSAAAGAYLAAMLVLEEDPELSDKLFSRYCEMIAAICSEIPMRSYSIADRYGI